MDNQYKSVLKTSVWTCVLQHATSPAAQLLIPRQACYQGKREQPRPPLKKNGWVSQRIKPFPVELPRVHVKQETKRDTPEQQSILTFDDLPKIRDKASKWPTSNIRLQEIIAFF